MEEFTASTPKVADGFVAKEVPNVEGQVFDLSLANVRSKRLNNIRGNTGSGEASLMSIDIGGRYCPFKG